MARTLRIRKPRAAEVRRLFEVLERPLTPRQRRRGESIVLYSAGLSVLEVAEVLQAHCETIYADLHAFDHAGIAGILHFDKRGAPKRILESQSAEILRLARIPPYEVGLPYGRWSLAKLRTYLIKRRVVKALSREHLRRVLKKGAWPFIGSNAN